jgi:hypothetical protein
MSFARAISCASALDQLEIEDVWLDRDAGDLPWRLVTSCQTGALYRNGIPVTVQFNAKHPATGLSFRWHYDLERRDANGSAEFHIDVEGCRRVMRWIPEPARAQFRELLRATADAVRERAAEYQKAADRQATAARTLADLCASEVTP